ncbi:MULTISPECIES: type II secretion system F family protein [Rhizobium]|uniref:type II secretion system F family protein n=1 Tax=Rhizobium TaxID=379 RepID=UPI0007EB7544|nr:MULTISPECIES: type II secretion system F family protein [Rhizobium]ANK94747.1 type II secretion system F domain-containing protein [Rhizobium sp. N6212]ANL00797.1 type II secretion system F domain-containing protein [Rhizobium sp. N621]ANL06918.1 type II secretion system F domain-containing protein [Rhizobium esperanzae]ANL13088.1 type II secretion system F domain-containing protein [Rhizobium sp. N1341]ANL25072.1 type II secretion system F domain-containing protein [Rhizobium sp. N113]
MSSEYGIYLIVFFAVLIFTAAASELFFRQREVSVRVSKSSAGAGDEFHLGDTTIADLGEAENRLIRRYFEITRRDTNLNSTQNRLIRAGYFAAGAVTTFQVVRAVVCISVLVAAVWALNRLAPNMSQMATLIVAMFAAGVTFILVNIYIDRRGAAKEREYRRLFPDFMDMLIVCLDAGMSIEAAANRVAREFVDKQQDFGLHLSIMMLEVRGGRRLREALANLATRLRIDEARALSVLFRQSEELGTSVTQTLRVYSKEMRDLRIVRAEEKANALPVKMLLPLGAFLFPVSLIIVLVPIVIRVITLLIGIKPGG